MSELFLQRLGRERRVQGEKTFVHFKFDQISYRPFPFGPRMSNLKPRLKHNCLSSPVNLAAREMDNYVYRSSLWARLKRRLSKKEPAANRQSFRKIHRGASR